MQITCWVYSALGHHEEATGLHWQHEWKQPTTKGRPRLRVQLELSKGNVCINCCKVVVHVHWNYIMGFYNVLFTVIIICSVYDKYVNHVVQTKLINGDGGAYCLTIIIHHYIMHNISYYKLTNCFWQWQYPGGVQFYIQRNLGKIIRGGWNRKSNSIRY